MGGPLRVHRTTGLHKSLYRSVDSNQNPVKNMSFSDELVPSRPPKVTPGSYRTAFFAGGNSKTASDVDLNILFQDGSGDVRYEVSDKDARVRITNPSLYAEGAMTTLGGFLDHEKLYEAYPELRDMPVALLPPLNEAILGAYSHQPELDFKQYLDFMNSPETATESFSGAKNGAIAVNPTMMYYNKDVAKEFGTLVRNPDEMFSEQLLSTMLHEIQHAIDQREGFEYGWDAEYDRRPGEVVARMVQDRRVMSDEERFADPSGVRDQMSENADWSKPVESTGFFSSLFGRSQLSPEEMHKMMMDKAK